MEIFKCLVKDSVPNKKVLVVLVITFGVCYWSKISYEQTNLFLHLGIGAMSGILVVGTHIFSEFDVRKHLKI